MKAWLWFLAGREARSNLMACLVPLQTCLDDALSACAAVQSERMALDKALGAVLADALCLPSDIPVQAQALRAGYAVAALDLMGASTSLPIPLGKSVYVKPGDALPEGCDAVLPATFTEEGMAGPEAVQSLGPGEGVRRAGHDGRAGSVLVQAGCTFDARQALAAAIAGISSVTVRRPRVRLALKDPLQAQLISRWAQSLGGHQVSHGGDLIIRTVDEPSPRLAFAPADTAWLENTGVGLVLHLPARFDGFLAGLFGLGIPALQHLCGARARQQSRPVIRKITSSVGMAELVLVAEHAAGWAPFPTATLSLHTIAQAAGYAIIPAESEGLSAGEILAATSFDQPFG